MVDQALKFQVDTLSNNKLTMPLLFVRNFYHHESIRSKQLFINIQVGMNNQQKFQAQCLLMVFSFIPVLYIANKSEDATPANKSTKNENVSFINLFSWRCQIYLVKAVKPILVMYLHLNVLTITCECLF